MARPGTTLTRSQTRNARSAPTATGPWFVAGITGTADADSRGARWPVVSLAEYATRFGSRAAHGANPEMYDAAEFYFKHGGAQLFVTKTADDTDAALAAALVPFTKDLGPGQVSAPGRSSLTTGTGKSWPAQKLMLAIHGEANNRVAVLATSNTGVVSTLTAEATIASITQNQERYTSLFGPWVTVPGVSPGTTRTISPESIVTGLMARNDGQGISPNQPSAGDTYGESDFALGVTQSFVETDRTTLNANGVNLLRSLYDGVRVYGYRTLADPSTDDPWVNLGNARLFMGIQARADAIAERYVFREIDGQRRTITQFGGALTAMLLPYWRVGSLYGATPEEAFRVDVGPNVNTEATIANKELHANLILRASEFAEEVILELVKSRTTEAV